MELALLMNVKNCIMGAQSNRNIIGVVYDALTGSYLLTQPETFVEKDVFMNITTFLENTSGHETLRKRLEQYRVPITSGRALFSSILPEDFYYRKGDVLIRDGILVSGVITKDHVGGSHGSIIQVLMKDYGQETTVNFLTDIYNIMREWLDVRGFSVGLDDCFLGGDDPGKMIEKEVQSAKMLVRSMGWKLKDPLEEERREKQIIAYLNTARDLGARISDKNLGTYNAFNVMAKSGAKGSTFNIAQITGIVGQQFLQGQRMPQTISRAEGGRSSVYYPVDTLDPASRGFIENSFLTGLTPAEMFFHQAAGREGLTDTAVKTAETGSMHHRVVKALEDMKVYEDGSVRNAFGVIFEYTYGEDGFNAEMVETVSTKTGQFASFINVQRLAARVNARYGYTTPGEPKIQEIVPIKPAILGPPEPVVTKQVSGPAGLQVYEIGDIVRTATGTGIVRQIEGERLLIQKEGNNPEWVKAEKLEL